MSEGLLLRGFFASFIAFAEGYALHNQHHRESGTLETGEPKQRYTPIIPAFLLPWCLITLAGVCTVSLGSKSALEMMFSLCFSIFLHIGVYFLLLLLTLPFLRRYISARACAVLWLLPNYLFLTRNLFALPKPRWILYFPKNEMKIALWIWLTGFAAVMIWKTVSHLMFRRRILKDARPVVSPSVLSLWEYELQKAAIPKPKYKPVTSANVTTPFSIGFFKRSIRVVLPEQPYTDEELSLIFRHEIVHIGRADCMSKLFLTFCTAMCWFNPLMWIAMRRCADDLELSCDETVLLNAKAETRQKYADLLLRTSGDEHGFTTCLSASAASLRYRLKNVVKPKKRFLGSIAVGLIFFLLIMSCGYVALAYDAASGREYIFSSQDTDEFSVMSVYLSSGDSMDSVYLCTDDAALIDYLAGLRFFQITGNYSYPSEGYAANIVFQGPQGTMVIRLNNNVLSVTQLYGKALKTVYSPASEIDWDYLESLLTPAPEVDSEPYPPQLMLYFNEEINQDGLPMYASSTVLSAAVDGEELPPDSPIFEDSGVGGVYNIPVSEVQLVFSQEPLKGYTVRVEDWEKETGYSVSSEELEEPDVLPLADYSAHYTVYASFEISEGTIYKMKFVFDIQLPENPQ